MEVEPLSADPDVQPRKTNREPLPLWIKLLFGGSIVVALVLAFWLRGSFEHFLVFFTFFCVVLAASVLAAALAGIVHWRRGQEKPVGIRPKIVSALVAIAFASGFQLMGYAVGEGLSEHDVRSAQRFLTDLVPALDRVREETGRYPESLEAVVAADADLPRLVEGRLGDIYQAEPGGVAYTFVLDDPRAVFFGGLRWDSATRAWHNID